MDMQSGLGGILAKLFMHGGTPAVTGGTAAAGSSPAQTFALPDNQATTVSPLPSQSTPPSATPVPMADPSQTPGQQASTNLDPKFNEHRGKWQDFLQKVQTDPNMKQAVLQMGLNMMQGPKAGENNMSLAGRGLETGVNTLQALRERDRMQKIQDEERALKTQDTQSQIGTRGRMADVAEAGVVNDQKKTGIAQQTADQQLQEILGKNQEFADAHKHGMAQLQETIRHNQAMEAIDKSRASAYDKLASGGGSKGADATKVDDLANLYIKRGMPKEEARAKATQEVMQTGKARDITAIYDSEVKRLLGMWQMSGNNIMKSPSEEDATKIVEQAKKNALELSGMQNAVAPNLQIPAPAATSGAAPAATTQAAPAPARAPGKYPVAASPPAAAAPTPNPLAAKVAAAKARGIPPEKIKAAIVADGGNPADYGM